MAVDAHWGWCSFLYIRRKAFGGPSRARTEYLLLAGQMRSLMRQGPMLPGPAAGPGAKRQVGPQHARCPKPIPRARVAEDAFSGGPRWPIPPARSSQGREGLGGGPAGTGQQERA